MNSLSSLWDEPTRRIAILDCVLELAIQHSCRCDEIQEAIGHLWNHRGGQLFECNMLCDCDCELPCDWRQACRRFELQMYAPGCNVTLHWACSPAGVADSSNEDMHHKLEALVYSAKVIDRAVETPAGNELCNIIGCLKKCDRSPGRTVQHRPGGKHEPELVLAGVCQSCYKKLARETLQRLLLCK